MDDSSAGQRPSMKPSTDPAIVKRGGGAQLRVLHVITDLQQGGAEAMLEKLILSSALVSPEVTHEVISLRTLGVVGPRLIAAGVPVRALGMSSPVGSLRALARLWRVLSRQSSDTVVQTWLYHADLLGGTVARLVGLRHVYWNLRVAFDRPCFTRTTYTVLKLCARLSRWIPRRIVACGPVVLESHVREGYTAERGVVLGNGFQLDRFHPEPGARDGVRAALGIARDALLIGTVARLHAQKDYVTLARAAADVVPRVPNAHFVWVGQGVDMDDELGRLLRSLGLESHVTRLGLRSDVPMLLGAMDIFCMSSRSEGFPNALGEAMACALPCVSTEAGDTVHLLGRRDWVVPTQSPPALAAALVRMAQLPAAARHRLGERNRARIATTFSIEQAWLRYLDLYRHGLDLK